MTEPSASGAEDSHVESMTPSHQQEYEAWRDMTEDECNQILNSNPLDNYARFRLSEIWFDEERNFEQAERLLESIEKSEPNFLKGEAKELLGDIAYHDTNMNYESAKEFYLAALKCKPNSADLYVKVGKCHEKLREFDDAIVVLKKALKRDKSNFVANYKLGLVYIRNNQRKEGLKALLAAHQLDPDDIETLLKISEIYLRDDSRLDEAERFIKLALELDNDIPEAHISLGRIYDKKGFDDMALEQYKIGIKSKMNNKLQALGQFNLGCLHERRKEFKQSISCFKQCLLYDQSHFGACIHLAT